MIVASAISIQDAHQKVTRLYALDLLRGICAVMVAAYHFNLWSNLAEPPIVHGIIAFWGLYGVSIFFILSGYSLAYSYGQAFSSEIAPGKLVRYMKRRAGRIAPLFVGILALSIAGKIATVGDNVSIVQMLSNATLLFGFYDPSDTPVIGGWSIGIEMVFYLILPYLIIARNYAAAIMAIVVLVTWQTTASLSQFPSLDAGWKSYVAPSNHAIFFGSGAFMALLASERSEQPGWKLLLSLGLMVIAITWICSGKSELELVTSWTRLILIWISVLIVYVSSLWTPPTSAIKICDRLGGLSYAMYLVHPLVFFGASVFVSVSGGAIIYLFFACVVIASLIDIYLDRPTQALAKRFGW